MLITLVRQRNLNKLPLASLRQNPGVGYNYASKILAVLGFNPQNKNLYVKQHIFQSKSLKIELQYYTIKQKSLYDGQQHNAGLRHKELFGLGYYKNLRRNLLLPVRGQRTHTNAQTSRKKRLIKRNVKSRRK